MIYSLYGLNLFSDLPFPELPTARTSDAHVHLKLLPAGPLFSIGPEFSLAHESDRQINGSPLYRVYHSPRAYLMRYSDTGDFHIPRSGEEIRCRPIVGTTDADIRACILGPVLALHLHLQRVPVLHASAVVIKGHAIAFIDRTGGGKSTTAAAFLRQGFPLLTDDILALQMKDDRCWGMPGYPALRLRPGTIARLLGTSGDFPRVFPGTDKRRVPVWHAFHGRPCPLGAIYLLDRPGAGGQNAPRITALPSHEAVAELLRNTYGIRWIESELQVGLFEQYCRLVTRVPARRIAVPRALDDLPAVCEAILEDLTGQQQ
ncbi:MAG: hypothetical protein GXP39_07575 [Chloroflexi bacterium]|nr:hypothetical protein [Chloroflexota bacterium]